MNDTKTLEQQKLESEHDLALSLTESKIDWIAIGIKFSKAFAIFWAIMMALYFMYQASGGMMSNGKQPFQRVGESISGR